MNDPTVERHALPAWLEKRLYASRTIDKLLEIEVKYIVPKHALPSITLAGPARIRELNQIYLPLELVEDFRESLCLPADETVTELRIRQDDDAFILTAKGPASGGGTERPEYSLSIDSPTFDRLRSVSKRACHLYQVHKTRSSYPATLAGERVLIEVDDYHATGGQRHVPDFVTCEVEVSSPELAQLLMNGRFFAPELQFLNSGRNVTGIKEFSNRYLAEHGLIAVEYSRVVDWLRENYAAQLEAASRRLADSDSALGEAKEALRRLEAAWATSTERHDSNNIELTQDVLKDLAFTVDDSLGRENSSDPDLKQLDALGKGWLRDYHEIISEDFYIRLHKKPQIYRPGGPYGYTNTTTRGAHTSDVVATSLQLARQLGLNAELCMASAAMHDIGHPPGGHVGEAILSEILRQDQKDRRDSGRDQVFEHHVFSLCLVDLFGLNLLREVQDGSLFHKSQGQRLQAEPGGHQEYGVVRIADKISYTPWDIFDSLANGYLDVSEIPSRVFSALGNDPMTWIRTLVRSTVKESSEAYNVQFTEQSGLAYEGFQEARSIMYNIVHKRIRWDTLKTQIMMCYETIQLSFPDVDAVAVVAYFTDDELNRLSDLIESRPYSQYLTTEEVKALGFGFWKIIERMRRDDFKPSDLYYCTPVATWESVAGIRL